MKFIPLNFDMMLNPVNWVIVWLMLAIAAASLGAIMKSANGGAIIPENE